jgi:hypothetical protein
MLQERFFSQGVVVKQKRISNSFTPLLTSCHLTQHITLAPSAPVASFLFIVQGRSNTPIGNTYLITVVEKSHDLQLYSDIFPTNENPMSLLKVLMEKN